jgi:hypothetical protein
MVPAQDEKPYVRAVEGYRKRKDWHFKSAPDSPIPNLGAFKGLEYFPVDPSYRFKVFLKPLGDAGTVRMTTSKGTEQDFVRAGRFDFTLGGKALALTAFRATDQEDDRLFVPFRDSTSGKETYGAGRYLDIEPDPDGGYTLDFNMAYNPYCAYSEDYICPLPPPENWLQVPIPAGEKNYR